VSRETELVITPLPTAVLGFEAGSLENTSPKTAVERLKPTVFEFAILFDVTSIDF
jgi:hypothetical protein